MEQRNTGRGKETMLLRIQEIRSYHFVGIKKLVTFVPFVSRPIQTWSPTPIRVCVIGWGVVALAAFQVIREENISFDSYRNSSKGRRRGKSKEQCPAMPYHRVSHTPYTPCNRNHLLRLKSKIIHLISVNENERKRAKKSPPINSLPCIRSLRRINDQFKW